MHTLWWRGSRKRRGQNKSKLFRGGKISGEIFGSIIWLKDSQGVIINPPEIFIDIDNTDQTCNRVCLATIFYQIIDVRILVMKKHHQSLN
jgi:hypothetical protein